MPKSFPLTVDTTVEQVADYLRKEGYPVIEVVRTDEPEVEDDDIIINERVSVQVGEGYAAVWVEVDKDVFEDFKACTNLKDLLPYLDKALGRL